MDWKRLQARHPSLYSLQQPEHVFRRQSSLFKDFTSNVVITRLSKTALSCLLHVTRQI